MAKNISLIGVGNLFRRDDGIGIAIARKLRQQLTVTPHSTNTITVTESSGEGTDLMNRWQGANIAYLFDAVMSNQTTGKPGTIHRLEAAKHNFPADFFKYSSHAFSLAEAVELARVLDKLPEHLIVYGVEAKEFGYGELLTPSVDAAGDQVINQVLAELKQENNHA